MKLIKLAAILTTFFLIQACSHPIEIVGDGDVTTVSGKRTCLLADYIAGQDNCSKNYVVGAYKETYIATPHVGWQFDRWGNYCSLATTNQCSFNITAPKVQEHWGQTMPPLQAIFARYKLTGPVLPDNAITFGYNFLPDLGYQKKEFFLAGTARSYTPNLPLPVDGKLIVTAGPDTADGDYKTRMVVIRPIDQNDFNGTVIVEWLNVTGGADAAPDWIMAHNEFVRSGYAYVGVSAQAVGVNALKNGGPVQAARYASLSHPGDSYSYDIFSRVGQLAGEVDSTLLGGLTADRVIATGESQSASRMVTYIDAVQPIERIYDGFMVHSRGSSGSSISQSPLPSHPFPSPAPIRDDLDVPVMVVMAEGDVINSNLSVRQPDTALFRLWEMAGTSHADAYTIVGLSDTGDGSGANTMFGYMRTPYNPFGCDNPMNAGAHYWIVQAAFDALDNWVRNGIAPPIGAPLNDLSSSPVVLARDIHGNALGGVRSPHVDAPVATLDANNSGLSLCRLFGSTTPLSPATILGLYPTKGDFLSQWVDAINDSVANGFLLQADAAQLEASANAWAFPN